MTHDEPPLSIHKGCDRLSVMSAKSMPWTCATARHTRPGPVRFTLAGRLRGIARREWRERCRGRRARAKRGAQFAQLQENALVHWVATRFTHDDVQEPLQHEGIALQTAVVQELQVAESLSPAVQTLCGQPPPLPQERVAPTPAQCSGTRSRHTSVQPVVQQAGFSAQMAATQELHDDDNATPWLQTPWAQHVPFPHAKSATVVQSLSHVLVQQ